MAERYYDHFRDQDPAFTGGNFPGADPTTIGSPQLAGYTPDGIAVYKLSDGTYATGQPGNWQPWVGDQSTLTPTLKPLGPGTPQPPPEPPPKSPPVPPPVPPPGGPDDGGKDLDTARGVIKKIPENFYPDVASFQYPDFAPQGFDVPEFQAPGRFSYPGYALPTGEEVLGDDPGYRFRGDEQLRALRNERSAAGTLKGGDTLRALMDVAGGLASQEYGAANERRFGRWKSNLDVARDVNDRDWRNALTTYGLKYGSETDKYNRAADLYKTNFGNAATAYGFGLDVAAGKAGGRQGASALAGNLALGTGNLALNRDNSYLNRLVSLYDISRRA
jgi:hypothetical protein